MLSTILSRVFKNISYWGLFQHYIRFGFSNISDAERVHNRSLPQQHLPNSPPSSDVHQTASRSLSMLGEAEAASTAWQTGCAACS